MFATSRSILGMNARNRLYISRYNSRSDKRLADNKIFTKQFLESRGLAVARLFHVIKNHNQLTHEFLQSLPENFVIKPNSGLAGEGILVLKKERRGWSTPRGKRYKTDDIYQHCAAILEGKYAISGVHDMALIEETLFPHEDFRSLSTSGLPDVRIIVFRQIPVMAMLRIPTMESEGKANMELGAIAMGIDMGTGKTTGAAQYKHFLTKLPNGEPTTDFQVPFWEEILLASSRIQQATRIGFLGVDIAICSNGIRVLEVNARPGLKIQIANQAPLRARLEKVADLRTNSVQEAVEISKTLFSERRPRLNAPIRPIIGLYELVTIHAADGSVQKLRAKIDPAAEKNTVARKLKASTILDFRLNGKRLRVPVETGTVPTGVDMVLGGKFLGDFLIDPTHNVAPQALEHVVTSTDQKMIQRLDQKLVQIDRAIRVLGALSPQNIQEQKELFFRYPDRSPRFYYRPLPEDLDNWQREIQGLPTVDHPLYGPLYQPKKEELLHKIELIKSRGSSEFTAAAERLYTKASPTLQAQAKAFIKKKSLLSQPDTSPEIDARRVEGIIQKFLKQYQLSHWQIDIIEQSVADIQVLKKGKILLRSGAVFQEHRLRALLAHEIGTHVFRAENGRRQPLHILEQGTAGYLKTEEGIAIYQQNRLGLSLGDKYYRPAYLVLVIAMAKKVGFVELFQWVSRTFPSLSPDHCWILCLRAKRGLTETENPGAFSKDLLYFSGYQEVNHFCENGGLLSDLYWGKLSIADYDSWFLNWREQLKPPVYLLDADHDFVVGKED